MPFLLLEYLPKETSWKVAQEGNQQLEWEMEQEWVVRNEYDKTCHSVILYS